ncbi:MAG: PTS sugar transporter subunit IIB [Deltaproteobacteria bacterium]|nr:PTS sugar transporter subunit IIB [Deltaproteobacteria bacterium]
MVFLTRVDDRLLHGQIMATWVPFLKADTVVVASDEVASSAIRKAAIMSCAYAGFMVKVETIKAAAEDVTNVGLSNSRVILIVATLDDAVRLYEQGFRFKSLNIGNLHHDSSEGSRHVTDSVSLNTEDYELICRLEKLGVDIDFSDVPGRGGIFGAKRMI